MSDTQEQQHEMYGKPWKVEGTFATYDSAKNAIDSFQMTFGTLVVMKIKLRADGYRLYSRENPLLSKATAEVEAAMQASKARRTSTKGKKV
jgi:hypothetical protein